MWSSVNTVRLNSPEAADGCVRSQTVIVHRQFRFGGVPAAHACAVGCFGGAMQQSSAGAVIVIAVRLKPDTTYEAVWLTPDTTYEKAKLADRQWSR